MADSENRKKSEKVSEEAGVSAKSATGASQTPALKPGETAESHLAPFAKPYNEYFEKVHEAYRANVQSAREIYGTYMKAAQHAIEKGDADAYRAAAEKFSIAWSELATTLASKVDRAFDTYHRMIGTAFASGASAVLGPGCQIMVARSITIVALHRTLY